MFKFFNDARVFDPLIDEPRIALAAVREPEREILRIVVRGCAWIAKSSSRASKFESDSRWVSRVARKKDVGAKINEHKGKIQRLRRRLPMLKRPRASYCARSRRSTAG